MIQFSPKHLRHEPFVLQALKKWTERQIDIFEKKGLALQQLRIKNPGQVDDSQMTGG